MAIGTLVQVVELGLHDDVATVRDRLGHAQPGRVLLVLPWDGQALRRPLEFQLVRREAERRNLEVAVVTQDPERRRLARQAGLPTFATVEQAQAREVWRKREIGRAPRPRRHWWEEPIAVVPRPSRPDRRWLRYLRLTLQIGFFLAVVLVLVGTAYIVVPGATLTLVPAGQVIQTIVPVSVDPSLEEVDHTLGLIPARQVGVEVEGWAEVETTGTSEVAAGYAVGTVLFTNLLAQDYPVPAGTIVRTSAAYPVRFQTVADVVVPAGGQTTAPVKALEEGSVGNVPANFINQVEGVAAYALRVTNPEPTGGGGTEPKRAVTQADQDRVHTILLAQLLQQAHADMHDLLEAQEFLPRQSLQVVAVYDESYDHFLGEQADSVGLHMSLLVTGQAVDEDNAEAVVYRALSHRLPPGYALVDAEFERGEVAEEEIGPGLFTLFVTGTGYAAAELDLGAVRQAVRGRPVAEARAILSERFPLAVPPEISVWPTLLTRLPVLPLRITTRVVPER